MVTILGTTYLVETAHAQFDFDAFLGSPIRDKEIDGIIGFEWADAGSHSNISRAAGKC